jgi:hypothetical protein
MASQWYCQVGNEQYGPFPASELKRLCQENRLLPDNLVRQGEDGRWIMASQVPGLFAAPAPQIAHAAPPPPRVSPAGQPASPAVRAVAASPAAAKPPPPRGAPAPVPVGVPVAPPVGGTAPPAPIMISPVSVTPRSTPSHSAEGEEQSPGKRKDNTALYVTVGLVACLLLLGGVGAAVGLGFFSFTSDVKGQKEQVVKNGAESPAEGEGSDPESVPIPAEEPADSKSEASEALATKSAANARAAPKPDELGKPTPLQEKSIRDVSSNRGWRDISKIKAVGSGNLRVEVSAAWLEGENVCVEVALSNPKGPGVLNYKSWNGAGKKPEDTAAVLLDSEDRVCRLVSREQAPHAGRKVTAELAPGESTTDVLVFEEPKDAYDHLRLALPYAAIGRTGALGFQIPRDMVALSKNAVVKTPAAAVRTNLPKVVDNVGGSTDKDIVIEPEPSKTAPAKPPADPDAPPNIKVLVERDAKNAKKQEAEKKAAEKPEP